MAVDGEIDAVVRDDDAFGAQAEALFEAGFSGEENAAAGAEYAMPWNAFTCAESPDDLAGGAGVTAGFGDFAVGGYFSFGDAPYCAEDVVEHAGGHVLILIDGLK